MKKIIVAVGLLISALAYAGTLVDQGAPGHSGPWPVNGQVIIVGLDGGSINVNDYPTACATVAQSVVVTGVASVNAPAAQLANRVYVTFCNSPENTGSPLIKITVDGTTPVIGKGTKGTVLQVSDCVSFAVGAAVVPKAISDTASTSLTVFQCSNI